MKNQQVSESIFQKRVKRFKSMKRGYYSLLLLILFYFLSLIGPLWMNNKALMIRYANSTWDSGEIFEDQNNNNKYDEGEIFEDSYEYYFPAIMDFISFIPGITYPLYESKTFNQNISSIQVNFRLLDKI